MHTELLSVQPGELKFPFELKKQVSCSLQLFNPSDKYVAFKVKTTSPKKYCVRPNTGVVLPQSTCDVTVTMQAQREAPPDMQCKDKFLIQSVVVPDGVSAKDVSQEMFNKESGKEIFESKLRVVYTVPPQLPSPVLESADEGVSPGSSPVVERMDHLLSSTHKTGYNEINELRGKLAEMRASVSRLIEEKAAALQKNQQLQQDIASIKTKAPGRTATETRLFSGFSLLFVFLIGFLGVFVGYLLRS